MIRQDILLEKYNWKVVVCFLEKDFDIDDAMDVLSESDSVGTPCGFNLYQCSKEE